MDFVMKKTVRYWGQFLILKTTTKTLVDDWCLVFSHQRHPMKRTNIVFELKISPYLDLISCDWKFVLQFCLQVKFKYVFFLFDKNEKNPIKSLQPFFKNTLFGNYWVTDENTMYMNLYWIDAWLTVELYQVFIICFF